MKQVNKTMGNHFEEELCELLAEQGFWAHNLAQNQVGQPADVLAVRDNIAVLIDCKVCSNNRFPLSRIEPNQEAAMTMWEAQGNEHCYFAIDLMIIGVRKAEKGIRSASYKTCFTAREDECDQYRPLFWYSDKDEVYYDELFNIQHSDCYTKYGMTRTGCVGCPFNRKLLDELSIIEEHEPKMLKAVSHVFKDSYEYTRMFREYVQKRKNEEKERTK